MSLFGFLRGGSPAPDTLLTLVAGDIVVQDTDAIINAADETLLGGTGVDGAIHEAAGREMAAACRALGGCRTGRAVSTPGFGLRAAHVIHTVAPVWAHSALKGVRMANREALAACHEDSLRVAVELGCASVSFPLLGTGGFGWPIDEAAPVAVAAVRRAVRRRRGMREVRFVAYGPRALRAYADALGIEPPEPPPEFRPRYHPGLSAWDG